MTPSNSPIILWDVMSTLVYDPIAREIPAFFGVDLPQLYALKHPTAWPDFEKGEISEAEFYGIYFPDDSEPIDGAAMREVLFDAYCWLDGVEELLRTLRERSIEMHALSNYPVWHEIIEEKLTLSRFLNWTFVSCKTGVRKPDRRAYLGAAAALDVSTERCLFIDDRAVNCEAARAVGMDAVLFESAEKLRTDLSRRNLL